MITWTSNLGSETAEPVDDALPEIQTPGGTILFNSTGAGNYAFVTPFAGIPGALYTVKFMHQGTLHEATTQMPHSLDISSFTMYMSPELTMETNPDKKPSGMCIGSGENKVLKTIVRSNFQVFIAEYW